MSILVKKARLTKDGTLNAVYIDEDGNEITMKGKNVCHPDVLTALGRLVPYFADLTEQKEASRILWDELDTVEMADLLRKLSVSAVAMAADDVCPMVTLTGERELKTGQTLSVTTPAVELRADLTDWPHLNEFNIAVRGFFYEVECYILEKKWAAKQLTLDLDEGDPFAGVAATASAPPINIQPN